MAGHGPASGSWRSQKSIKDLVEQSPLGLGVKDWTPKSIGVSLQLHRDSQAWKEFRDIDSHSPWFTKEKPQAEEVTSPGSPCSLVLEAGLHLSPHLKTVLPKHLGLYTTSNACQPPNPFLFHSFLLSQSYSSFSSPLNLVLYFPSFSRLSLSSPVHSCGTTENTVKVTYFFSCHVQDQDIPLRKDMQLNQASRYFS